MVSAVSADESSHANARDDGNRAIEREGIDLKVWCAARGCCKR